MITKSDEAVNIFRQLNPENQEIVLDYVHVAWTAENSVRESLGCKTEASALTQQSAAPVVKCVATV
ncbi:hypothetical protein FACS1894164_00100 [Spirochaetia bacterium]|nr:hypothetical protein FACS1894164_00100 [Spirochaetia bacterium]